jgi:capsular exopolysaccharide synthesis family protein
MGVIAGLTLPSGFVIFLLMFDDRLKSTDDLRKATAIPILGLIPHHHTNEQIVMEGDSNTPIAEAFRSVRTNLGFMVTPTQEKIEKEANVIQLTSTIGSEGKSFCSINLATSLAHGGLRTIVVGLDLRKPRLAELFDVSNSIGSSSVLAGIESLDKAIMHSKIDKLDILVGGPIPPNPSELLMSDKLGSLIEELRTRYHYVILDCPPIGLVTDSLIISKHADTTMYLTRQGVTKSKGLAYINDLYASKKLTSVSILFNDVKRTPFGYGYGAGFTYGYGSYAVNANAKSGFFERIRKQFGK